MEIATPYLMTGKEYRDYSAQKEMQSYWKQKNASETVNNEDKFSVSDMKFNIGPADKVFGPGGVQVKHRVRPNLYLALNTIISRTLLLLKR